MRPREAFLRGFLFGVGMFGAGVNWLYISMYEFGGMNLAASVTATAVVVAYLALFPGCVGFLSSRFGRAGGTAHFLCVIPSLWTLGEWVRSWLFSGFPWLNLGYSQTDTLLGGFAVVGGVFGLSALIAIMAGSLVLVCSGERRQRLVAMIVTVLLAAAAWSAGTLEWTRNTRVVLRATLVQGAVPQQLKWRDEQRLRSLEIYRKLTEPHWDSDIIVWPETAIPAFKHQVQDYLDGIANQAVANGADLYVGLPYLDPGRGEYFNSVFLLNRGETAYHKRHLVPFGEYLPLKSTLRAAFSFLQIPMSDFSAGRQAKPVIVGDNAIAGISICYEDTFGEEVIQALPESQILINVSNDAWFGDSAAPHQHLQMARMRSLETRRYLLRATNTGISAVIDDRGRILARSPQFAPAVLGGQVELIEGLTPYARFGNMPIVIAGFLGVLLPLRPFSRIRAPAP
ncbi:MAG: apolipoprotein N-acyltransferase [Gammaproteobacteria bacterium]|nr:apolipoprotein N-acyltransferase [Gammaproteobacteria bacterium]